MSLRYLSADQLLADSQQLALMVLDSGFQPDLLVALWRGGTPVGIAMQEVFMWLRLPCEHFAIRSSSYEGIGTDQQSQIRLWGLELLKPFIKPNTRILLVDDVFDTGRTFKAVIEGIHELARGAPVDIKLASPWFKPGNNRTPLKPDFHLHTTAEWLVFPHELQDLTEEQVLAKPGDKQILKALWEHHGSTTKGGRTSG